MRTLLALTCCLALTAVVRAEDQDNNKKNKKNKHEQTTQQAVTTSGHGAVNVEHGKKFQTLSNSSQIQTKQKLYTPNNFRTMHNNDVPAVQSSSNLAVDPNNPNNRIGKKGKFKAGGELAGQSNLSAVQSNAQFQSKQKTWVVQNFKLQRNTQISPVRFQANAHIVGSQNWKGANYNAFRIYVSQRHDRDWWVSHHNRIILVNGGYYYWDSGWWYPAWGYDPHYEFYAWDGPIYGYNDLPPDQVIANVQSVLQQQGYYHGLVDGMLGPLTRAALAEYQAANGLYPTSAIDRPTLASLGMV